MANTTRYLAEYVATGPANLTRTASDSVATLTEVVGRAYGSQVLSETGLVSYWRLGEPSGTTAADSKGTNPGTYVASPTLGAAGALVGDANTAVTFVRASSQQVSATVASIAGPVTVEAWVNATSWSADDALAGCYDNSKGALLYADAQLKFFTEAAALAATRPSAGVWHHLVGTHDGTTARLYVDGVEVANAVQAQPTTPAGPTPFRIAAFGFAAGSFANATIDEVALYNVALTANQVLTHYTIGTGHAAVVRTSSATVATLTEAVARGVTAFARTVTDSVATLTEAVTRISAKARTVAQTLGATTEAVARVGTFARSQSDSLATLTESVSRIGTFARSVADAIATITEAVVGVKSGSNNFTATVADSLATLTEAVTRIGTFGRTQSDSVATITEVVGEDATEARTSADTIASITEATGRLGTFARSTSDTVASITEAVVGVVTPGGAHLDRTAGDTLSAVTESVARGTTTFSRTATDSIGAISEAITAPAAPITTPTGGGRAVAPYREHPSVPERRPRPVEREPVAFVRSAVERVEFIDERLDSEVIESDEWLVLDMPELVLA